jgi:ribosomal protein S18 acetylase RimI-like enzyme
MSHKIRDLAEVEIKAIAKLWHDSWHDAHASIVPEQLTRLRSLESFIERTKRYRASTRAAFIGNLPAGLCITKNDELYQIYVMRAARGTGLAQSLMDDAEDGFRLRGVRRVWLVCAIGNDRAAHFYRKSGWTMVGSKIENFDTDRGLFQMEASRFEKSLPPLRRVDRS